MKKKELKNLAERIAQYEYIIQTSQDQDEIKNARAQIMALSSKVKNLEDIMILDEMIQDFIGKI
jgi:hypothetical protein